MNLERTPRNGELKSFGYKQMGYFMEYGPVQAPDEKAARALIRQKLGVSRLAWGVQIWDLSVRPLATWRPARAS